MNLLVKNSQHWAITESALKGLVFKQNASQVTQEALLGIQSEDWFGGRYQYDLTPEGIAIINVQGALYRYDNFDCFFGDASSYEGISSMFMQAMYDKEVKGIMLYVNSPGGEVDGLFEISEMIRNCNKPTLSYVAGMAASAGYGIASSCDMIVSQESAMTGSIGVISTYYDNSRFLEKIGIDAYTFVSSISPNKAPDPKNENGQAKIQATTDKLGEMFLNLVATNRRVDYDFALQNYGQGGIALGEEAANMGLVDVVGSLPTAIEELNNKITGANAMIYTAKPNAKLKAEEDKKEMSEEDKEKMAIEEKGKENAAEPVKDETAECEDEEVEAGEMSPEEEEKEIEKDKEVARFAKTNPGLFARVKHLGSLKERKRQEECDEVLAMFPDQKQIIAELRYGSTLSAAEISFQSAKNRKNSLGARVQKKQEDASQVPVLNGAQTPGKVSLKDRYASNMQSQLTKKKGR